MNDLRRWLFALSLAFVACAMPAASQPEVAAPTPPATTGGKWLIEAGVNPSTDFVRANIQTMERRAFDGLVIKPLGFGDGSGSVFRKRASSDLDFAADRENLAATKFVRFKHNFMRINAAQQDGWSWLSDPDWAAAETSMRRAANAARAGKLEGFAFDAEPYGMNPWLYTKERYPTSGFEQVSAKVRERGRAFMTAIQAEVPNPTMLLYFGLSIVRAQQEETGRLEDAEYALLAAFIDGWADVAQPGAKIIDGNEGAYYYLHVKDFENGRRFALEARALLSPANRAKPQLQVGSTVYMDLILDLFDPTSPDCAVWCGVRTTHFLSRSDQLRLLERNTYHALKMADEYVWVYSEEVDWWRDAPNKWWGGTVPDGAQDALKRARAKIDAGQPLGFDLEAEIDAAYALCQQRTGGTHC